MIRTYGVWLGLIFQLPKAIQVSSSHRGQSSIIHKPEPIDGGQHTIESRIRKAIAGITYIVKRYFEPMFHDLPHFRRWTGK